MSAIAIVGVLLAGVALGLFFFGGLWLTVARLTTARHPAILAVASFWIRTAVVAGAMLLVIRQHWQYGLILILGFALGRVATSVAVRERRPL